MSVMSDGTTAAGMAGSAVLSGDGVYRYTLNRRWGDGLVMAWIMLNPSTADAVTDDPTITRCIRRAQRWQWKGKPFGGICVLNLFALRATDPAQLRGHPDPVGPENDKWLSGLISDTGFGQGSPLIAAWGAHGSLYRRSAEVREMLAAAGTELWCLGTCASGEPAHPLMLPYSAPWSRLAS